MGEENYKEFKKLDVGDVIGIEGEVFRTKTGEMSIHAAHVTLLSKSLQILPEKFHGLTKYGHPLPSEICGSDHEPGSEGYICKTFKDPELHP